MRTRALPLLLLTLAACGDPLVEGNYRGEPLIEFSGTIRVEESLSAAEADSVRVGLHWVGAAQHGDLTQGRSESSFPARYSMKVFARPPVRAMRAVPDRNGLYGIARIVLFIDEDGDDRLDALERIVGAAPDQALTYFTSSEPTSLVRGLVRNGYQVMQLFGCEEQLADKATFGEVPTRDAVDLVLATGATAGLLDIDCDAVNDDLCFDLRLQLQASPGDAELVQLYEDLCDVADEPEFNSRPGEDSAAGPDGDPTNEPDPDGQTGECTDANAPDCPKDPTEPQHTTDECEPLLGTAVGTGYGDQREAYWRFRQCTADADPCAHVEWAGGEERWMEYQACVFEKVPDHHRAWCGALREALEGAGSEEDRAYLETELVRGGCDANI